MSEVFVDGVCFHVEISGSGPPLVLLHGFTGSTETWSPFLDTFGSCYQVIAVDLLGHGLSDSPPDPRRYCLERSVEDLRAIFDRLKLNRVNVLGYSLGGRVALNFAVAAPERVAALVLESASPGIPGVDDRKSRIRSDNQLAGRLDYDGIGTFVDYWENLPLFASQRRLPAAVRAALREQRLRNNPLGLANSLRGMGAGAMAPLFDRLGDLRLPTLIVVGALDAKYRELGQVMATALPDARLALVPDAGHAVHLEQPEEYAEIVLRFLARG